MTLTLGMCLLCLLQCGDVFAHREKESLTTLSWNPRTEMVEIIHSIHQHDAQEVLHKLTHLDRPSRDLGSVRGRASIALLVEQALDIRVNREAVDTQLVGATLDADSILVFQEFSPGNARELNIRFTLFDSIYEDFVSRVTVLLGGLNRTVFFDARHTQHTITLAGQQE